MANPDLARGLVDTGSGCVPNFRERYAICDEIVINR
jgi:hypothetical protein